jgi:4-amino-4-deoxy-L-arabinose transferase-like glycosyltransferase
MWERIRRNPLCSILLCALALRLAAAGALQHRLDHVWQRQFLIEGDASGYWELAERMADGRPYEVHDPPRRVHRMPGFPAVLAVGIKIARWTGMEQRNFLIARLLLAGIGTIACGLVYLLGAELFDKTVGLWGAAITAITPTMIGFSLVLLGETLFAVTLLASLLAMARLISACSESAEKQSKQRIVWLSLAVGTAVALACYARPIWVLAAPIFACFDFVLSDRKRAALLRGMLIVSACAFALLPWTIRNWQVTGHVVPMTLWLGPSLYDGLNPQATGDSDMQFFDDEKLMARGMSEYEMNRHYTDKALRYALDHPAHSAELALIKLGRFWKPWPNAARFSNWPMRLAVAGFFLPLLILALRGWYVCRSRTWCWLLTVGPILYFSAIHMVFVGSLRYRLPAEYPLAVLAGVALAGLMAGRPKSKAVSDLQPESELPSSSS